MSAIFGNQNIYPTYWTCQDEIRGSHFTCPEDCNALSISAYIRAYSASYYGNVKFGIYRVSDGVFIAQTDEIYMNWVAFQWLTLLFSSSPSLVKDEVYLLVYWTDKYADISHQAQANAGKGLFYAAYAPSFPSPWGGSNLSYLTSIYCTYDVPSPSVEPILPRKLAYSGYHCFIEQYQRRRIAGLIPFKLPDGTLYPS